jgi:putative Ca2+/H+ antiporter (TMEM165/GDT1 family)
LLTVGTAIFVAELTDKDALLLLSLATRFRQRTIFAAGAVAFTITSAIIVTVGQFLVDYVPVSWVTLVGGAIMVGYGFWSYKMDRDSDEAAEVERKLSEKSLKGEVSVFLSAVGLLALLDLAGDATEVLTIIFVARFQNVLIVFIAAVVALITATAVETTVGRKLSSILSANRIRIFSLLIFLVFGMTAIISALLRI